MRVNVRGKQSETVVSQLVCVTVVAVVNCAPRTNRDSIAFPGIARVRAHRFTSWAGFVAFENGQRLHGFAVQL